MSCYFIAVYQDAFNLIDKDADGSISKDNLGAVMKALGEEVTDQQLQDLINEVDADGTIFIVDWSVLGNSNNVTTDNGRKFTNCTRWFLKR